MIRKCLIFCCLPVFGFGQMVDKKLQEQISALVKKFHGDVGVYVVGLKTGKVAQFQADSVFPTASMVKVPILVGIMDKINRKELGYHQEMIYKDSLYYAGEDILGSFKAGEKIQLSKVIMLMLTTSDNTASLWLQGLAGGGMRINELMDSLGMATTRVNSRTPGRASYRDLYGWGQTTPKEMVALFELLYKGKIISDSLSKKMIRLLGRNYWDEEAILSIPSTVFVASKNGAVDASRSETLLVMAKEPYIFSVITKNQQDKSWEFNNEGWVLTRRLSALLYTHFSR
jgi:beta-lactamase class A